MRTQIAAANLAALKMLEEHYQPCDHPVLVIGEMASALACEALQRRCEFDFAEPAAVKGSGRWIGWVFLRDKVEYTVMADHFEIREMVPTDAKAVAQLAGLFEPVSTTVFQGIEAEDIAAWVREHLAKPEWAGFVAEVEGEVVGFVFCQDMAGQPSRFVFPQVQEMVYLLYLAVDEAFRGRGIARALIRSCEALAHTWGRTSLLLDVAEDNPALRLYRRLGFKRLGAQVFLRKTL